MERVIDLNDRSVIIDQQHGRIHSTVWDSAITLVQHMLHYRPRSIRQTSEQSTNPTNDPWRHVRVLELGAGTGIGGLAAAILGADAVITDRLVAIELIDRNIQRNLAEIEKHGGSAVSKELSWDDQSTNQSDNSYDIILASDCVYEPEYYQSFINELLRACDRDTVVLISQEKRRSREITFWRTFNQSFFLIQLDDDLIDPDYVCPEIGVFEARLRAGNEQLMQSMKNQIIDVEADEFFVSGFPDHLWQEK